MDDQLDNDLKNRIREVFDNYEDTTADEGWLLLREKFPVEEKKRPVVWMWWASAAAGLLLFISLGVWMLGNKPNTDNNTVATTIKKAGQVTQPQKDSVLQAQIATTQNPAIKNKPADTLVSTPNTIGQNNSASVKKSVNGASATIASIIKPNNNVTPVLAGKNGGANSIPGYNQQVTASAATGVNTNLPAKQQIANNNNITIPPPTKGIDSNKINAPKANDPQYAVAPAVTTGNSTVAAVKPANTAKQPGKAKPEPPVNSMDALFAAEGKMPKKSEPAKPIVDRKVKFGVYAATFFNYAKGSSNQVNGGAGFTSDIKLGSNFKLSTGVALAQNTLKYASNTPPNENAARTVSYAAVQADNSLVPASSFPVFKNYNASLVGLDVPINIKYEFNPQRTDAFISAGVSSGTFINEAYTTSYGVPHNSLLAGNSVQTTEETTRQSFNGFYFARTLNVSVGVGAAVGKNRLVIEPFVKYPLQGMGAQQIKFGAGGINLKFNFAADKR
jgi:hypothetical protein